MKALTINIHSHFDKMDRISFEQNINTIAEYITRHPLDVIAIQECSQTLDEKEIEGTSLGSFVSYEDGVTIKADNYAYLIVQALSDLGQNYNWTWTGAKIGYDRFDEGLAILTRHEILDQETAYISKSTDYSNWKVRKVVGICIEIDGEKNWFYSTHMGWWKDEEERFVDQMNKLQVLISNKEANVFLMGDFNSQSDLRGEGYDYVKSLGWHDTYERAGKKDAGITVPGTIDGWTDVSQGMRIDYIFSKNPVDVKKSEVIFNGKKKSVISDHFGVLVTL
ncbi:MAG: endonuclease/exonuclease/phosphatase family protein [Lachnospiraceae bacterium]|nr:endonuclease/exonuclease/phosphatase family protein [Lachnospiraceae bacterium]